jgi:PadR family transcriptional regulator, regulatory protein PadR
LSKYPSDRLHGALDLLVLKSLKSQGRMHGYGITLHIQYCSRDVLRVEEGSLYPALRRMEKAGWLQAEWGLTENQRRARYYSLTPAGERQFREAELRWGRLAEAIGRILQHG